MESEIIGVWREGYREILQLFIARMKIKMSRQNFKFNALTNLRLQNSSRHDAPAPIISLTRLVSGCRTILFAPGTYQIWRITSNLSAGAATVLSRTTARWVASTLRTTQDWAHLPRTSRKRLNVRSNVWKILLWDGRRP